MTTPADEDEFTRLSEFHPDRVDLVKNAANGTRFLITKQDAGAGLLDPQFVRDLIAKAPQEETPVPEPSEAGATVLANGIVIKGSPDAMAAFLNAANARPAPTPADVAKARGSAVTTSQPTQPAAEHATKETPVPETVTKADPMDAAGDAVTLDEGMDGMDPTVPLAAPDGDLDLPGDPTDPGSPAWEGIDAASAQKWLSIAARLKNALGVLAEREMLEAASADPDDIENAWNLQDAMCAVDFAIEQLAVFAAGEQAEAELGAECEAIGKALAAFDTAPLGVIEGLTAVAKAGRVLSSANEAAIRAASESLQKVLASLPEAPVAKQKEAAMAKTEPAADVAKTASPEEQARDKGPVNAGGTTGMGQPRQTGPEGSLPGDGPQAALPGDVPGRTVVKSSHLPVVVYDRGGRQCITRPDAILDPVAKADGDAEGKVTMQAVFDEKGNLVGIVDPADITPVSGAGGSTEPEPEPAAAAPDDDMTPQPPADAGVSADAVGKAADEDVITVTPDVLKSAIRDGAREALEAQGAAHQEVVAKMAAGNGVLAEELKVVKARLVKVEETPAAPGVFTNGAVPPKDERPLPPQSQLRGQDAGAPSVDVAKAAVLKETLYNGSGPAQAQAFHEMEGMAIAEFHRIRGGQRSPAAAF